MKEADQVVREATELIRGKVNGPRLGLYILDAFDGLQGLANEYRKNYDALPHGNNTKVRQLDQIIKLVQAIGEANPRAADAERDTDELESELRQVVDQLQALDEKLQ